MKLTIIDGEFNTEGKHPQVIFSHRCPLCRHEWVSVHVLLLKPGSPDDQAESGERGGRKKKLV